MTLKLPSFELFEQGSQVRRSTKSIKNNLAEGYGRKKYKNDFVRFLIYSHASCDEAISQLSMISDLYPELDTKEILADYISLSKKINKFIQYVEVSWK